LLDALGRHLVDAHAALADDAGIVDERAERTELVGGREQRQNVLLMRDIAFHRDRLAVTGADLCYDLIGRGLVGGVTDDDPKAARGSADGGGAADAPAAAGDDGYFVGQKAPQLYVSRPRRHHELEGSIIDQDAVTSGFSIVSPVERNLYWPGLAC